MLELIQAIPFSFGALFPVVNPIGSSIIFLAIVNGVSKPFLKTLALKISLYVTIMLIIVLFAGSSILRVFGITIPIVLIGGGIVLTHIGWQLLNKPAEATPTQGVNELNVENIDSSVSQMTFFPLTMPVTAGPGCIAVAIAVGAHGIHTSWETTLASQIGNSIGIILVGFTVFFCYRYAFSITSRLGATGTQVIMRFAAFINLCIGLELIWHGIQYLLPVITR